MTDEAAFASDAEVVRLGERFVASTLSQGEWTHAAHLAAAVYLFRDRPDLDPGRDLPRLIRDLNAALGVVEGGERGYNETITQFYVRAIGHFLGRCPEGLGLAALCNRLVASPFGDRALALLFYSRGRLFSPEAKTTFVQPDLRPLVFGSISVEPMPLREGAVAMQVAS